MNIAVRAYINRWTKQIDRIKYDTSNLQKEVLLDILSSPYFKFFNGDVLIDNYKEKVLTTYDDYKVRIEKLLEDNELGCKYFAQSSGTTSGTKKLIPTPEKFVRKSHLRGSWYILHTLYEHNVNASVFDFKNLLVGGSIYNKESDHIIADVSGIMLYRIPTYMRPWYVGDIATAVLPSWEEKLEKTVEAALATDKVALLGGIPTWLLTICREVLERSNNQKISELWPGLQAYIHGGVNFEPYRGQFEELIDVPDFRYIEVYNATEGFFAYQDRPGQEGMLLMCADGIYYEFIRLEDYKNEYYIFQRLSEVVLGESYVMTITTYNGLCRYVQGDILSFVTLAPYRIKVTGRVKEYINAFGEDLLASDVDEALALVLSDMDVQIRDFTIAPSYVTISQKGRHDWCVEFQKEPEDLVSFEKRLDDVICRLNNNYSQKRSGDVAMSCLKIHVLPSGTIDRYFLQKSHRGGQQKLQKLSNDRKLIEELLTLKEIRV